MHLLVARWRGQHCVGNVCTHLPVYTVQHFEKHNQKNLKKKHFELAQLKLCYKLRKAAERMFWGYERKIFRLKI
jgi:hypothetical protein